MGLPDRPDGVGQCLPVRHHTLCRTRGDRQDHGVTLDVGDHCYPDTQRLAHHEAAGPTPARHGCPGPHHDTTQAGAPGAPAAQLLRPLGRASRQVILVDAHGSGATIRACKRSGSRYRLALGPYYGHVGINGVSSAKREGDLHTPTGVFPMRNGFGVNGNPGLGAGSWLRVDASDVWVDDPRSSLYNTHQRSPADGRWLSAERLLLSPAYNYAQVIGYNEGRTPGRGSAIFMHVDQERGTAGVSHSRCRRCCP